VWGRRGGWIAGGYGLVIDERAGRGEVAPLICMVDSGSVKGGGGSEDRESIHL